MTYNFKTSAQKNKTAIRTHAAIINANLGVKFYEDSIPMWVADMDFECAPEITRALKTRAELATFGYSAFSDEYFKNLKNWFLTRHGMHFETDEVVFSPGTVPAIRNMVRAFTKENEGVIIQPPVYYPFKTTILDTNRALVENHLKKDENNHYSIDFADFEAKCADSNNKMFILCNPHNPIGQIWSPDEVQKMMDICAKHSVLFLSDEVHADIIRRGASFTSALNLKSNGNLIVATAVNKTFNLAGLHITNLIIPDEKLRKTLFDYTGMLHISPFSEAAAVAAYGECAAWVDEMNAVLDENIAYMKDFISQNLPKIKFNAPAGTYLTWLDVSAYEMEEKEMLTLIAEEAHLILEGGSMFGVCGEGFLRVNVACPKEVLADALNRLAKVLR